MTNTRKIAVAAIITLAAGFTIHQTQKRSQAERERKSGLAGHPSTSRDAASSRNPGGAVKSGPRSLLKPRLDEVGRRHLQQDPGGVLSAHSDEGGDAWSHDDDDLLVAWAARDPEAAMKWVDGGGGAVRAQNLGAVAAGILLREGKDAMRRFLGEHQQDPELRPKDQGELEHPAKRQAPRRDR